MNSVICTLMAGLCLTVTSALALAQDVPAELEASMAASARADVVSSATSAPATAPSTAPAGTGKTPLDGLLGKGNTGEATNPGSAGDLGRLMAMVLVLVVIAGAAIVVTKRLAPKLGIKAGPGRRRIKLLETSYIGPKRTLHLVQVGAKTLLIAGAGENIRMLADVTDALVGDAEAQA